VEEDEKVLEDPSKRSVDDLLEDPSAIGTKNIEGPDEGPPSIDEPGLGLLIETPPAVVEEAPLEMFDVQKPPSFPGGEAALMRFLAENIKYPDMAREAGIQGVVVVSFVVGKDGNINDISLLKEVGGGCSKEALRVVKTMPRWSPGEAQGHAVKVRFTLPVRFALQ
jgi:protein TonB